MAATTFAERLAYLIFMRHALSGRAPSWKEVGDGVGVTGEAVLGWSKRKEAPPGYSHVKGLVAFFAPVTEEWLVGGRGEAPVPELYREWRKARATAAAAEAATDAATRSAAKKRGRAS